MGARVLKNHCGTASHIGEFKLVHIGPVDMYRPGQFTVVKLRNEGVHSAQAGGFPAARCTDQKHGFTCVNMQRYVIKGECLLLTACTLSIGTCEEARVSVTHVLHLHGGWSCLGY